MSGNASIKNILTVNQMLTCKVHMLHSFAKWTIFYHF